MLVRSDPFRQFDRLAEQVFGTPARPAAMPMDAWRDGHNFVVEFDLPGIDPSSIDLDVERNVLTVRAERKPSTGPNVELVASERPRGVFSRQVILGDALDIEAINAAYTSGVLRLTIPVAERAKPRKIAISTDEHAVGDKPERQVISTTAEDRQPVAV
ncbi:MAG: Hsp20/alpha crystallin family protein [Acidimicrobiales bacterium]|jgi:HSP20 family protein